MKFRLFCAALAVGCFFLLPGNANADLMLSPMASSPLTGTGQGGLIKAADLNDDGLDDLVIGSAVAPNGGIHIRLANTDGTWTTRSTLESGKAVGEIATDDLNGDGKPDLLVNFPNPSAPLTSSGTLRVFLGNGDGTFANGQSLALPGDRTIVMLATGQAIHISDINGDGKLELWLALTRGLLGVALGNGDGTFSPVAAISSFPGAPSNGLEGFGSVITGDFNGDENSDFVFGLLGGIQTPSTAANSGMYALFGQGGSGFGEPIRIAQTEPYGRIMKLISDDVDGDGFDDLIADVAGVDAGGSPISRFLLYPGGPNGLDSAPAPAFSLPLSVSALIGDDFDGDGNLDLGWIEHQESATLPNSNQLLIATGDGAGSFNQDPSGTFNLNFSPIQAAASSATTGDFDGDGSTDFATSFQSSDCSVNACGVSVLLNRAVVELDNGSFDFGTVNKNSTPAGRQFTLTNRGGATARLGSFDITGAGAGAFSIANQCEEIPPGGSCSPSIRLATGNAGLFAATLVYEFEGITGDSRISVTGTVVNYHGALSPSQIDFGEVRIGETPKSQTVTLTADGESGLSIGQLSVDGAGASSFGLGSDTCSGATLSTGATCSFEVSSAITTAGAVSASLNIPSNGQNTAGSVPLSATGIAAFTYRSSLKLTGPKKVKAGKKFKVTAVVSSTGSGSLTGLVLKYKAAQGKATRAQGSVKLGAIAGGGKLTKAVTIALKKSKLKRGVPVRLTFSVLRQGKTIASREIQVRQDFGQVKPDKRN